MTTGFNRLVILQGAAIRDLSGHAACTGDIVQLPLLIGLDSRAAHSGATSSIIFRLMLHSNRSPRTRPNAS